MITVKNLELESGVFLETCYVKSGNISLNQDRFKASYSYHANPDKEPLQWDYLGGQYLGGNIKEQVDNEIQLALDKLIKKQAEERKKD